ncbi:RES family NAD+ phosphorylase [Sulfurimonas lithotrophica]|uniref:RES family NAD+ phosphorylase n=1 Tax=Sulfurimonas lithotrophica TaxID=2590022 RepID=A0A5P8P258_9BACT|nr:RES family NAD+ phosphorylase [Sulfurimonas lithotrophica]QFR49789.1 RES family NAD+ phosphorylase [Sulfurimonas lithotrophica]
MDICEQCFESNSVSNHIISTGKKLKTPVKCSECGNYTLYRLNDIKLKNDVQKIIRSFYEHEWEHGLVGSAGMIAKEEGDDIGLYLPGLMTLKDICYMLFEIDCDERFYELLKDYDTDGESEFDQSPDEESWLDMGCKWEGSDNIGLEWEKFCENVKHKARFFDHSGYSRISELSKLNKTFETLSIETNKTLYRARKITSEIVLQLIEKNAAKELGKAPFHLAGLNRFSPNGIPYVYLSEEKETAMLEIRLQEGEECAIGEFQTSTLNLVDLRNENLEQIRQNPFSEKHTPELICSYNYIQGFVFNISKPIKDSDKHLDYIPTQIVSEYIWSLGYDGFIFDSSLCDGDNYVLFDEKYTYYDYEVLAY